MNGATCEKCGSDRVPADNDPIHVYGGATVTLCNRCWRALNKKVYGLTIWGFVAELEAAKHHKELVAKARGKVSEEVLETIYIDEQKCFAAISRFVSEWLGEEFGNLEEARRWKETRSTAESS